MKKAFSLECMRMAAAYPNHNNGTFTRPPYPEDPRAHAEGLVQTATVASVLQHLELPVLQNNIQQDKCGEVRYWVTSLTLRESNPLFSFIVESPI